MDDVSQDIVTELSNPMPSRRRLVGVIAGVAGALLARVAELSTTAARRRGRIHVEKRRRKRRRRNRKGTGQNNGPGGGNTGGGPGPIDTTARRPFPQHVTYASGTILPSHRSRGQLDDDVRTAYERWKTRYVVAVNPATYRIAFGQPGSGNHGTTVSEGQGFGMMIVALLAGHDPQAHTIFDGLWRFALTNRSCIDSRLMLWRIPNANFGCSSATDGDLDITYGLLLADAQWGSGDGVNYGAAAATVLDGLLDTTGAQSKLPMLGDWVDPGGDPHNQWTPRSSDLMPGHFRAFARASGNGTWNAVAEAALDVVQSLQERYSPETGLLPDFIQPESGGDHRPRPADAGFLEGPFDGAYNYNAGRDPWRLGTDALLNSDARSLAAVARISNWIATATGDDPLNIRAGYLLDGNPRPDSDYFTTFFAAPFGVAAMATLARQAWLNAVYDAVRQRQEDYYEDSVNLLSMLVMTGNFWDPTK